MAYSKEIINIVKDLYCKGTKISSISQQSSNFPRSSIIRNWSKKFKWQNSNEAVGETCLDEAYETTTYAHTDNTPSVVPPTAKKSGKEEWCLRDYRDHGFEEHIEAGKALQTEIKKQWQDIFLPPKFSVAADSVDCVASAARTAYHGESIETTCIQEYVK